MKNKWEITQNIVYLSNRKIHYYRFNILRGKLYGNQYKLRFVEGLLLEVALVLFTVIKGRRCPGRSAGAATGPV